MATGIVSTGLDLVSWTAVSLELLGIASLGYDVLWVFYIWRAIAYREETLHDIRNPDTVFAYFTIVAATDVLAVPLEPIPHFTGITLGLAGFATQFWFTLGYVLPWQVFMKRDGTPILSHTNGTWFVWAVACQPLAIDLAQIQKTSCS